ncbi:phenylalanine--tRNA ligase subunit beta [Puniceicoccales bacterium CK1056]|uniref:Phenylalanine--tRNA ligase beta subunit n=1 Tax=Oceanipulchritudo coccoides TaxID=2706888 RepID=A0A6B2LY38_9BACT|nr:phenylalanine--tRNA ligase subunit beta [Oceanipulchritudo coccoides]NDV61531.1 phenylalanine--tRNA ligase subunit beta [Oceanipulchritudo coccoides]
MKVSLEWLNEYVDLSGLSVEEISHALTMVGFEVEGISQAGLAQLEHVVVGEITSFDKHPNADRLSVCEVDVGTGELQTIVCGAKNFRAKDRVIAALPGSVLPGNFKIKKSKLRGVVSNGMLCSERELGIGDDHAGIAILEARPAIGTPVNELYPEPDSVFDIEITPNRPDALSHIGIARELAAWFKRDLRYPELQVNPSEAKEGKLVETLESVEPELCPHYRGYNLRGVAVGDSPEWLKRRLTAIGLRPINNVVDATNYILHETGQPLHAFDVSKIRGSKIIVRSANAGEKLVTLDDKERVLKPENLVIADADRALVVAGVMGSVDAEVDDNTQDIFLEAAWFNPVSVRRTSKQLGLSTDSSYRFERGVDPKGAEYAALRCLDLIIKLAGGELLGPELVAGEPPLTEREVELSPDWVREQLGFEISDDEMEASLSRLELDVSKSEDDDDKVVFRVGIPSYRLDLYRPIDLVEEVVRMFGSDRIPEGTVKATVTLREDDAVPVYQRRATSLLTGKGFQETVHYSLRDEKEMTRWNGEAPSDDLSLANPLASDASHLRTSIIPALLDCLKLNAARHNEACRLFECGRVFREFEGTVYEVFSVGFVITQEGKASWKEGNKPDYYTSTRIVTDLLEEAGILVNSWQIEPVEGEAAWQSGHAAKTGALESGYGARFGLLDIGMTREWDIESPVLAGEVVFLPEYLQKPRNRANYKPFSLFPPAIRDLALVVPESTPAGKVEEVLRSVTVKQLTEGLILESVEVFDIYAGKGLPEGHKSIACKLIFRNLERTLTDKEVNMVFQSIQSDLDDREDMSVRR